MIVDVALFLTLTIPDAALSPTPVDFVPPVEQVVTYPPVGVVKQISGLPLPDGIRDAFEDEFKNGQVFFGAFAITKDFGYGFVTGANSLEAARDIAIQECLKQGPACLIYAEILPEGYAPLRDGQVSLAPEAASHFNAPDPSWNRFRAMAISEDGAYSVVWGHSTPRAAADAALSDCDGYTIDNLPELRPMPCVLVPFK